jgi:hypothetical protein
MARKRDPWINRHGLRVFGRKLDVIFGCIFDGLDSSGRPRYKPVETVVAAYNN